MANLAPDSWAPGPKCLGPSCPGPNSPGPNSSGPDCPGPNLPRTSTSGVDLPITAVEMTWTTILIAESLKRPRMRPRSCEVPLTAGVAVFFIQFPYTVLSSGFFTVSVTSLFKSVRRDSIFLSLFWGKGNNVILFSKK